MKNNFTVIINFISIHHLFCCFQVLWRNISHFSSGVQLLTASQLCRHLSEEPSLSPTLGSGPLPLAPALSRSASPTRSCGRAGSFEASVAGTRAHTSVEQLPEHFLDREGLDSRRSTVRMEHLPSGPGPPPIPAETGSYGPAVGQRSVAWETTDHTFTTLTLGPSGWPSLASGFDFRSQPSHLPPNGFETHPSSSLLI